MARPFVARPDWSRAQLVALAAGALVLVGAFAPWADLYTRQAEPFDVLGTEVWSGLTLFGQALPVPMPHGRMHDDGQPNVPALNSAGVLVALLALAGLVALFLRRPHLRAFVAPIPFALIAVTSVYHLANIRSNLAVGPDCAFAKQVEIQWGLYLVALASTVGAFAASRRKQRAKAPVTEPDAPAPSTRAARAAPFALASRTALKLNLTQLPARRRVEERVARATLVFSSSLAALILGWLLWRLVSAGAPHLDVGFIECYPTFQRARLDSAGIRSALFGSWWLAILVLATALPVGILAGVYMNEYARRTRVNKLLRLTIANLAGVPSVVFGILGLAIFVRQFGLGFIVLAGALTLAVLSLPLIIVATEEALKAVPRSVREAAYGLGATKWQVTKDHVLPNALPGIATGAILALARAVGETAPLILVGGAVGVYFTPTGPDSLYTSLPLLSFAWAKLPQAEFRDLAAATTVVLLLFIVAMNLVAILLRNHFQKKLRW